VCFQIHYNNPELKADSVDSSGVRFYYSLESRPEQIGILQMGDPFLGLFNASIPQGIYEYSFACPSSCTTLVLDEPVTVLREHLHMHQSGTSIQVCSDDFDSLIAQNLSVLTMEPLEMNNRIYRFVMEK
jgi:hypothetical protein